MLSAASLVTALALDQLWGDPRRAHPLAAFGRLAQWLESRLYAPTRQRGLLAVILLVLPWVVVNAVLTRLPVAGPLLAIGLLYLALGGRSLGEHARRVSDALAREDLQGARIATGQMVSRDTRDMNETQVARATVESVLENGNDAVFAALFWFALAGAPGVVAYRLINTLDAMWGYRNGRYRAFGWVAARLDDALNFIPARLTALTYMLLGRRADAWYCWRHQGGQWESPNAGPVMAAGAGALGVELGGPASYNGHVRERPRLGAGEPPGARHIEGAVSLVNKGTLLWLCLALLIWGGLHFA